MFELSLGTNSEVLSAPVGHAVSAAVEVAVPAASSTTQNRANDRTQSTDSSTGTSSLQGMSTDSSNWSPRTMESITSEEGPSSKGESKIETDLNLPKGLNTRDNPLPILSGLITNLSTRQVAEGTYSNIWKGMLTEEGPVGSNF
jgi:hypothetical protein